MAAKTSDHHNSPCRRLAAVFLISLILVLFVLLLAWLILRPSKPQFTLQTLAVFALNLSAANSLTTTFQITLASRNPNRRISIHYEEIAASAAYRGRHITLPTRLPPTYQGHEETVVWSPFLYGNQIPFPPYLAAVLNQDQIAGTVLVSIRLGGGIWWKVGTAVTWRYRLNVKCPAYVNFNFGGKKSNGVAVGTATFQNQLIMECHVDVGL